MDHLYLSLSPFHMHLSAPAGAQCAHHQMCRLPPRTEEAALDGVTARTVSEHVPVKQEPHVPSVRTLRNAGYSGFCGLLVSSGMVRGERKGGFAWLLTCLAGIVEMDNQYVL